MCKPAVTWSIKAIIFWMIIYVIFWVISSKLSVHAFLYLKQMYGFTLDNGSALYLLTHFQALVEMSLVLLFVCFILRRKQVSLRDIGIQVKIRFKAYSSFIILGTLFNVIGFFFHKYYELPIVIPSTIEQSHWPFTLGFSFIIFGLLVPFVEELVFRGILFQALRNQMSAVPAIAIDVLIFATFHIVSIISWVHFVGVLLLGCITCIVFIRTGSLNNGFIFHASMNMTGIVLKYFF